MTSKKSKWVTSRKTKCESDAVVVGAPVDDALFDGFGFEALGYGLVDEDGELGVGGEAEGDDLLDVEFLDVGEVGGRQEGGQAEVFLEADDAVLNFEVVDAGLQCEDQEGRGDNDPPQEKEAVLGPVMDNEVDRDKEIESKDGKYEEVKGWVDAAVVSKVLRCGHGWSFLGEEGTA